MNWLNLHTATLRAPEYIGSEPVARATWLNVLAYCCEQENGGRIIGAATWKDRQWQQTCGVTAQEVREAALLLTIDGDDVLIWRYPDEKESEVQRMRALGRSTSEKKREAARKNGSLGGRTQQETQRKNPTEPNENNPTEPIEGNGREWKGIEENGIERAHAQATQWFPESLRNEAFIRKWNEWEDHLRESGKPISSGTRRAQLSDCERHGMLRAIEVINLAFTKGWKSLVWDHQPTRNNANTRKPTPVSPANNNCNRNAAEDYR